MVKLTLVHLESDPRDAIDQLQIHSKFTVAKYGQPIPNISKHYDL